MSGCFDLLKEQGWQINARAGFGTHWDEGEGPTHRTSLAGGCELQQNMRRLAAGYKHTGFALPSPYQGFGKAACEGGGRTSVFWVCVSLVRRG